MKPATIRSAETRDVQAIERLLRSNALPEAGVAERLGTTLVALDDGSVVGTAADRIGEPARLCAAAERPRRPD